MPRTYKAILKGDRVKWTGDPPKLESPVQVEITVVEESSIPSSRGDRMAEALRKLAKVNAFSAVADPVGWQRKLRTDRPLPGREKKRGSNIIIYAAQPEHEWLREFIADHSPFISAVSYVEALGYHDLSEVERMYLEEFF